MLGRMTDKVWSLVVIGRGGKLRLDAAAGHHRGICQRSPQCASGLRARPASLAAIASLRIPRSVWIRVIG